MTNRDIASIFVKMAKILELKGDNPFKVRAYLRAARSIEALNSELSELIEKGEDLKKIEGIGKEIEAKIKELIGTGHLSAYEKAKKGIPSSLLGLLEIPGLGPKTVAALHKKLGIKDVNGLEAAARKNKLIGIANIREKAQANILKGIEILRRGRERIPLKTAFSIAEELKSYLAVSSAVEKIEIAGSLRRRKETIGDIDILIASSRPQEVGKRFLAYPHIKKVLAEGETKYSFITSFNLQVDLRIVDKRSFGAALLYFTGSKDFNISLRRIAQEQGYKINEYGIFSLGPSLKKLGGEKEKEIFNFLKMRYIPPVLREDRGEIELALKGQLPLLVKPKDVKGDLHVHSHYSDGENSLDELARKAQERGYRYLAVCDHSQSLKVAGGLDKNRVKEKEEEIKRLNKKFRNFRLLFGSEVDILSDGKLDYPPAVLERFDIVIGAIHTGFKQSKKQLTKRIISAIKSGYVHIIAHPTGRLFGVRDAYELDFEKIIQAALDYNVALEINCYPQRMDLDDIKARAAAEKGVVLSLGTDAHCLEHMDALDFGISLAQRGWLGKDNLINTLSLKKLYQWLSLKR